MRPAKLGKEQILRRLNEVFRARGYEGASYSQLMAATGLVKASLYHRYPGGKEEMVNAILSDVDRGFKEDVLRAAYEAGPPEKRARQMARRLGEFYHSGERWCLLDTLTIASGAKTLTHAKGSMEFWIDSFARVARDAGLPSAVARRRAEDAVAAIEGGLIISRVTKNARPFLRALESLPTLLTKAEVNRKRP